MDTSQRSCSAEPCTCDHHTIKNKNSAALDPLLVTTRGNAEVYWCYGQRRPFSDAALRPSISTKPAGHGHRTITRFKRDKVTAAQLRQLPFVVTPAVNAEPMSAFGGKPDMMRTTPIVRRCVLNGADETNPKLDRVPAGQFLPLMQAP